MSILLEKPKPGSLARRSELDFAPVTLTDQKTEELEISRLARAIWSNLGYVLGCAILCAAIGYGISRIETPSYRSSATVELLGVNSDFLNLREVQPNASTNVTGTSESYLQTQIELFSRTALLERTLLKLGRIPGAQVTSGDAAADHKPNTALANTLESYSKRLRIEQVKESNLLQITFEDKDPVFAGTFVNALVAEATGKNIEDRWKSNDRLGILFSKQVELLRHRMETAEGELQAYSRQSGLLYTGEDKSVAEGRLTALEEERSRADADRIQKEARYRLLTAADPASLPEILGNETLRSYQTKLADLRRERAELAATMTPENPKVLKIDAQINAMQSTLTRETQDVIKGVVNEYQAARQRAALLNAASTVQADKVSVQAEKAIHYNTLKREVDTTRGLYEAMLRRMNDAEVMSTINASDIRVVDAARTPLHPAKPNKAVYTGIGFLNGLLLPLVFVFVREYRNQTIQAPRDLPSLLHVSELGVVPSARGRNRVIDFPKGEALAGALLAPRSEGGGVRQARDASRDLLKDSFRGIATSILFGHSQQSKPLTLVFSSPHEAEGKTTAVFNVGVEMAAFGKRILLVDGDLRRPTLHRFFDLPNGEGLSTVLAQPGSQVDPLTLVKPTGIANLSLLSAGAGSELSAGWLRADGLRSLLAKLSTQFDLILVDSAPLLLMPETRVLANAADGLILVFRAGKTSQDDATAACRRAAQDGTPLFGTILNDWKPLRTRYGYYARRRA